MAIGKRVKALRLDRGLSQAQVAEAIEVEPITISRFETGRAGMGLSNLLKLANALQVPLSGMLDVGLPAPVPAPAIAGDTRRDEWLALWDRMSDAEREIAHRVVTAVPGPNRRSKPDRT